MNSWRTLYKLMYIQAYHFKSILKSCLCPFKQTYLMLLEIRKVYTKYVLHVQKFFFIWTSSNLRVSLHMPQRKSSPNYWVNELFMTVPNIMQIFFGTMCKTFSKNYWNTLTEPLLSTRFCLTLAGQLTVCQPRPITVDKWSLCNLFEQCAGDHFN